MALEEKSKSSSLKRPFIISPWIILGGGFLLYLVTLNHWVTLSSLPLVAKITGWDWHPLPLDWRRGAENPFFFLCTCPVRILSISWQPLALNLFSSVCGAITLGLLAGSVRLLPHDRTREQRQRENGGDALLSIPFAFVPPLLAVLLMGFQLTFWHNATVASVEIFDLAVFATLIYFVLRFRISQNDNWLYWFGFLYGLGTTDNWALLGFFPLFLISLVWIKGVNFFNGRFLAKLCLCGLAGMSLYLITPAMASLGQERANFWQGLHFELGAQSFGLFRSVPRWVLIIAILPTLLPLAFAGFFWPSFEEELSSAGTGLTKMMFRLLHVFFFVLCVSLFLDFKYSPSVRLLDSPISFLTFYYIGALAAGYFSGYILLVFGKNSALSWERPNPLMRVINVLMLVIFVLAAVAVPAEMLYKNVPRIRASTAAHLDNFSKETARLLPSKPAVILADDPTQLYLLQAQWARQGRTNSDILIDTTSLPHRDYLAYLFSHYPELKTHTVPLTNLPPELPSGALIKYLYQLKQNHTIYYLNPSFGYFFEVFYLIPHGIVYELQTYAKTEVSPPVLNLASIKENSSDWNDITTRVLPGIIPDAKHDPDASALSVIYSADLNLWGTQLQKAGYVQDAHREFVLATNLYPQNYFAQINLDYNDRLLKNNHRPGDSSDLIYKAVVSFHGFVPALKFNGPGDEPGLNLALGEELAEAHNYRQAAIYFMRNLQLQPGEPTAQLGLAKTYVDWGAPGPALDLIKELRVNPAANKWDVSRVEALAYFAKNDYPEAERLLRKGLQDDPKDENRVAILAEFYRLTAYGALKQKKEQEATVRFKNALVYIDQEIKMLRDAGLNSSTAYGVSDTLLRKAEVEMMLKSFDSGITTLNEIIDLQPNNPTALLNRAVAELQTAHYQAAKDDYKALRKLVPKQSFIVDYGLADIASKEKNRAEEMRCLKRYLEAAPKTLAEYPQAKRRLKELEGK